MSSGEIPAPAQALALWRSTSVARASRHSSRRAQAISPGMSCGGGRRAASFGEWPPWFLGRRFVAIPGAENADLRSQTRPVGEGVRKSVLRVDIKL